MRGKQDRREGGGEEEAEEEKEKRGQCEDPDPGTRPGSGRDKKLAGVLDSDGELQEGVRVDGAAPGKS